MAEKSPPRDRNKQAAQLRERRRQEQYEDLERQLRGPLAGKLDYELDSDTDLGRMDRVIVDGLNEARLEHERDGSAIQPLRTAVDYLHICAVKRAALGLAAPQWPAWLIIGLKNLLWDLVNNEDTRRRAGRRGRHAKELSRRVSDGRDLKRATAVQAAIDGGLPPSKAYHEASRRLQGGSATGSWKVMYQAYRRVQERHPTHPKRYQ